MVENNCCFEHDEEIVVSILCLTYNHENFISQALDSFLMQKTNFNIEIIVHDDASTDKTPQIVLQYYKKNSSVVVPILQNENQYSKSKRIMSLYMFPKVRGKYIAICEGDDYWTDPYKLQKQVDYMENHSECSACIHAARKIDALSGSIKGEIRLSKKDENYDLTDAIRGLGSNAPTNSTLYRTKLNEKIINIEEQLPNTGVSDNLNMIIYAMFGTIHYMDQIMSVYRVGVPGSWSSKMEKNGNRKMIKYLEAHISLLFHLKSILPPEYEPVLNEQVRKMEFYILRRLAAIKKMKSLRYHDLYAALPLLTKIKLRIKLLIFKLASNTE